MCEHAASRQDQLKTDDPGVIGPVHPVVRSCDPLVARVGGRRDNGRRPAVPVPDRFQPAADHRGDDDARPRSSSVPENVAPAKLDELAPLRMTQSLCGGGSGLRYCWDAPVLGYQPLYFEEVNLERYGYGPRYLRMVQPVLSGAHFFAERAVRCLTKLRRIRPIEPCTRWGIIVPAVPAPYRVQYPSLSLPGGLAEVARLRARPPDPLIPVTRQGRWDETGIGLDAE